MTYDFRLVLRLHLLCFGPVVGWIMPAPVIVNPPKFCDEEGTTLTVLALSADGDALEVDCWDCERTKADEGSALPPGESRFDRPGLGQSPSLVRLKGKHCRG